MTFEARRCAAQAGSSSGKPHSRTLTDEDLKQHPLAVWAELAIGLEDGQELKRKKPIPFEAVAALDR
jgi:hypothetical protein